MIRDSGSMCMCKRQTGKIQFTDETVPAESFEVDASSTVTNGPIWSIPGDQLKNGHTYRITIDSGALQSLVENPYAGISVRNTGADIVFSVVFIVTYVRDVVSLPMRNIGSR